MQCPFLNRFTASFIRNYAETLCQSYGSHCPVVGKTLGAGEKKLSLVAASVTRSYSTGANANAGAAGVKILVLVNHYLIEPFAGSL